MAVKKQWYEIVAPKVFEEKVIGETLAAEPKQLIGRKIETSLFELSKDYSKFYIKLQFQIDNIEDSRAFTKFVGHDIMRERIYRMVQRRVRRVDVIMDVRTKDNVLIRVKTVFVLLRRVNTSIKAATRVKAKEVIEKTLSESSLDDFVKLIVSGELAANIRKECNRISPVGGVEIRKSEVQREKKKLEKAIEVIVNPVNNQVL